MKTQRLLRIAADAEKLRWQSFGKRILKRAIYGAIAALFGLATLTALHVIGFMALQLLVSPLLASVIILAVDLCVSAVLAAMALRGNPAHGEIEAIAVRQTAMAQLVETLELVPLINKGLLSRLTDLN